MSRKEAAFSLMSDSEDSLLGPDSPIFGTARGGGVDVEIRRAIEVSKATFAVEDERRRSFGTVTGNREDSESDEDLEVLAADDRKPPAKRNGDGPRLSISGGERDPVQLLDNDNSDDDSEHSLGFGRLAAKLRATPLLQVKTSPGERVTLDLAADNSSDSDVPVSGSKMPARPARKKTPPAMAATSISYAAVKPSVLSQFDSSDSESSITALKQKLQASRQPKMIQFDSSDDDSSPGNWKSAFAGSTQAGKSKASSTATTKKTVSRKKAPPIDKERKLQEKREKEERRQHERLEKQVTKQKEKEDRALKKKHEQMSKQAAKLAEKDTKKRRRDEAGQATGKFASQEIAVLMQRELCQHATWNLLDEVKEAGYSVTEYPSLLGCNAVQWIRKDFLEGGAADALQMLHARNHDGYQHLPVLAIVFDVPHDFIQLLEREEHEEEDDYPQLQEWLLGIQAGWKAAWSAPDGKRPRIILLLHKVMEALDRLWVNHRKRARKDDRPPPTAEELQDAITWILIQFQVECIHCHSSEDVSHNLNKMTRLLSEEPYILQVTELECIKKIKACSDLEPPFERSKDCWLRQLQQVPRISLTKARNLTRHYPTSRSLWDVYQDEDLTEDEKRVFLSTLFDEKGTCQAKLSDWVYRVMTSKDPNEILR
jgi:hypothetical protein